MSDPGGGPASSGTPGPQHAAPSTGEPSVSTAPAGHGARWWSAVPTHLGKARTSTVILAVLFLAIGMLYLTVHPTSATSARTTTTGGGGPVAPAHTPAAPSRTRTSTPAAPSTTPFSSSSGAPTPTQSSTSAPAPTSVPAPTTSSAVPSSSSSATAPAVPTTSSAPTS